MKINFLFNFSKKFSSFSASFYIFINCVGIKPMPALYVAEILPDNVSRNCKSFSLLFSV